MCVKVLQLRVGTGAGGLLGGGGAHLKSFDTECNVGQPAVSILVIYSFDYLSMCMTLF